MRSGVRFTPTLFDSQDDWGSCMRPPTGRDVSSGQTSALTRQRLTADSPSGTAEALANLGSLEGVSA